MKQRWARGDSVVAGKRKDSPREERPRGQRDQRPLVTSGRENSSLTESQQHQPDNYERPYDRSNELGTTTTRYYGQASGLHGLFPSSMELDTMKFVALYCMPHFPESRSGCYLTNEHVEGWLSRERYSFRDCSRSIVSGNV